MRLLIPGAPYRKIRNRLGRTISNVQRWLSHLLCYGTGARQLYPLGAVNAVEHSSAVDSTANDDDTDLWSPTDAPATAAQKQRARLLEREFTELSQVRAVSCCAGSVLGVPILTPREVK